MMVRLFIPSAIFFGIFILSIASDEATASHQDCRELHAAAFMDEPQELQKLIEHGVDLECRDVINQTPLITATEGASLASFSILITQGVDVHARDEIGQTALDKAKDKLAFFDMPGGETYHKLYQQMIKMLIAAEAPK